MRTDTPQTIRLKDYCPPAYLIDKVDLDIALDPSRTRVRSKLKIRRNPASTENGGPLRLNGENLELATILLDKAELQSKDYEITETELVIRKPPEKPFTLTITTFVNPGVDRGAAGYLPLAGDLLLAVRSAGLPPHYLFSRPAGRSRRLHRAPRGRPERGARSCFRTAIPSNAAPATAAPKALRNLAGPAPEALLPFSRWSAATCRRLRQRSRPMSGREVDLRIYVEHGKEARAAWAMNSLKRSMGLGRTALRS